MSTVSSTDTLWLSSSEEDEDDEHSNKKSTLVIIKYSCINVMIMVKMMRTYEKYVYL